MLRCTDNAADCDRQTQNRALVRIRVGMSSAAAIVLAMSFALMPYVVDLDTLHGSIGSQDDKLRRMIGGRFKEHLDHFENQFAGVDEDDRPSIYQAIRTVIDGGPFDDRHGTWYGYAYKWICEFYGRPQPNPAFSPMKAGWLETVDEGLAGLGVTAVRVEDLSYGSPPSPLPVSLEMVPGYGEWSLADCRKALEQWEAATVERRAALAFELREPAENCMAWCKTAVTAERGVAAFFY